MQNEVLVSFIIPCLNGENFISTCLDSIISQTVPYWEVFVVDNGSDDNSIQILQEYAKKDDRIHVLSSKIKCQSTARNIAIEQANGKYLCFIDIDDFIANDLIESYLTNEQFDFYFSNWNKIKDGKQSKRIFPVSKKVLERNDIVDIQRWIFGDVKSKNPFDLDTFSSNCGKFYKTSIVKKHKIEFVPMAKIGGSEDAIFNMQFLEYAQNGYFSEKCLYNYVSHTGSYTHKRKIETLNLYFEQHKIQENILREFDKLNEWGKHLSNRLLIVSLSIFIVVSRLKYSHKTKISFLKNFLENEIFSKNVNNMNVNQFGLLYRILLKLIMKKKVRLAFLFVKVADLII